LTVVIVGRPDIRARLRALLEPDAEIIAEGDDLADVPVHVHPDGIVVEHVMESAIDEPLTAREREVLEWLAEGLSNRAIADRLDISEHTVKFHVASVYGKLGVSTRTQAVRRGLRRGLISM
jgi:two-component system, NarL family, response regulator YdfI